MGNLAVALQLIEQRRLLHPAHSEAARPLITGWTGVDAALRDRCPAAALHEWFGAAADSQRRDWAPPLGILTHLALQLLSPTTGPRWVIWIGRSCFPYPQHWSHENDETLLRDSIFVTATEPALRLWAADLAVRCPAIGLVIVDGARFPMAATRRLQLLAGTHGKPILSVRPPWERGELSAAHSRWLLRWQPGAACTPRWSVELLRCKGMQPAITPHWVLERQRATGRLNLLAELAGNADQTPLRTAAGAG